jgi:hypothetical protein
MGVIRTWQKNLKGTGLPDFHPRFLVKQNLRELCMYSRMLVKSSVFIIQSLDVLIHQRVDQNSLFLTTIQTRISIN